MNIKPEALLETFVEDCQAKGYAGYIARRDLGYVRAFLKWTGVQIDQVKPGAIEAYKAHLAKQQGRDGSLKPQTIRHRLTRIKRFYRWLTHQGLLMSNPFDSVELPSVPRQFIRRGLTQEELDRVMDLPDLDTINGIRVRAILETFYSTGLRQSELARLLIQDLDPAAGLVLVRQGKGRKDRIVPVGERALHFLDRYLYEVRPRIIKPPETGFLFLSFYGKPFGHHGALASLVRRYFNRAGIHREGACHLLRHSAATHMLQAGAGIRDVQAFLGHAQLETTSLYTRLEVSDLRQVHRRCHPAEQRS